MVRYHTELQFKLLGKFGDQQKDCGIRHLGWLDTAGDLMSFLRGENNVVQVFSSHDETVIKQRHYKDLGEIRGLHSLTQGTSKALPHAIIDKAGQVYVDDLLSKAGPTKF